MSADNIYCKIVSCITEIVYWPTERYWTVVELLSMDNQTITSWNALTETIQSGELLQTYQKPASNGE